MILKQLPINTAPPRIMHIDLNSCFATIEAQANRLLRGRPVGVAAYDTPRGFVLAANYMAKAKGVKLGVNVGQARLLCPGIVIMTPDPSKYKEAHRLFKEVLLEYTPDVVPKSIDEFVLNLADTPSLKNIKVTHTCAARFDGVQGASEEWNKAYTEYGERAPEDATQQSTKNGSGAASCACRQAAETRRMQEIGNEIKERIYEHIGEAVTVNVGIAPNRFLAKYAAGFNKPNGLTIIDHTNLIDYLRCRTPQTCASLGADRSNAPSRIQTYDEGSSASVQAQNSQETGGVSGSAEKQAGRCEVCGGMDLVDLPGINTRYRGRLQIMGIKTPLDFFNADPETLQKHVFGGIVGYHWHMRLRGWEMDNREFARRSIGHQYALSHKTTDREELAQLLMKLCEKTGRRLRKSNFYASGIHLYLGFVREQTRASGLSERQERDEERSETYMKYDERAPEYLPQHFTKSTLLDDSSAGSWGRVPRSHSWHKGEKLGYRLYGTQSIYEAAMQLLSQAELYGKVKLMSVNVYGLEPWDPEQMTIFDDNRALSNQKRISDAMDDVNSRYGEFVLTPATMMDMQGKVLDRIAFGNSPDVANF